MGNKIIAVDPKAGSNGPTTPPVGPHSHGTLVYLDPSFAMTGSL